MDSSGSPPLEALREVEVDGASEVALAEQKRRLLARMFEVEAQPTQIEHYTLLDKLGAGGMGVVYAAYDPQLDRKVAIKLLRVRSQTRGARQLRREARAMARLTHPNVVQIYEIGEVGPLPFIVMELVEGQTLRTWLEAGPRSRAQILGIMDAAGRGLAAAHAKGIIHRDFKPENVMIRPDGRAMVTDFGLAGGTLGPAWSGLRPIALDGDSEEGPRPLAGTPAYMAPEQLRGAEADARADQYSFCLTLVEALTGRRPAPGELADSSAALPKHLRRIVTRGLARDPDARWPSIDALLRALDPRPRRRRRIAIGGGAASLALAALPVAELVEDRVETRARVTAIASCEREAAGIDELWTASARARLLAAAAGDRALEQGEADGDARVERALSWIDGFCAEWTEAARQACVEAEVEGTRSRASLARVERCLAHQRLRLETLLAARTLDSPLRVEVAALALSETPSCLAPVHQVLVPPPADLAGAELRALERELVRLELELALGPSRESLADSERLLARARALDWPPLTARVLLASSATFANERDIKAGLVRAREAQLEAVRGDDQRAEFLAVEQLLRYEGIELAEFDDGLHWAAYASALAEHLELDGTIYDLRLLAGRARLERKRGAYAEALALLTEARARAPDALPPAHPMVLSVEFEIAAVYAEWGRVDEALATYHGVLATIAREHPHDSEKLFNPLNGLGNMYLFIGQDALARRAYEAALAIHARNRDADVLPRVPVLDSLGRTLVRLGDRDGALAIHRRAYALNLAAHGPAHPRTAHAQLGLARAHAFAGELDTAATLAREALAHEREVFGSQNPYVALTLNELGAIERARGELDTAAELHREALDIQTAALGRETLVVANTLSLLAQAEAARGRFDAARGALARAMEIRAREPGDPRRLSQDRALAEDLALARKGSRGRSTRPLELE